jgi:hypothetical protein
MHHAFLRQISARDHEAAHVINWDQAGFHQNTDTSLDQLTLNVPINSLPPYSPELNLFEKLGDLIQDVSARFVTTPAPTWKQPSAKNSAPPGTDQSTFDA